MVNIFLKKPNITDRSQDIKPSSTITKKKKQIRHKPFAFKQGDKACISHLRSALQKSMMLNCLVKFLKFQKDSYNKVNLHID